MHTTSALRRGDEQGFSMVEILVVLSLIALLSAIAIPRLSTWGTRERAGRALNQIAADIGLARMRAVRAGNTATLAFGTTGASYTITAAGVGTTTTLLKSVNLTLDYPRMRIFTSPATATSVVYDSRGLPRGSYPTWIIVSTGGFRDSLQITALGKVTRVR